ncbi:keywimysin-related RiPP [Nocardia asteroides]
MENTVDHSNKKQAYEKPAISKTGDFRALTGGLFTTQSDLLVGRRGMI